MIAAIYSRKSSDQSGIPDAEKSFARQIEHARAYAATKGWIVANEYLYTDDGISGAEFAARPGFLRLMNALKPRPAFNVLIMSEESRLGREAIETAYVLKQIVAAGVRAAAHNQMAHHRRRYAAKPYRPVFVGREPKYLLSGFLRCAVCGAGRAGSAQPFSWAGSGGCSMAARLTPDTAAPSARTRSQSRWMWRTPQS